MSQDRHRPSEDGTPLAAKSDEVHNNDLEKTVSKINEGPSPDSAPPSSSVSANTKQGIYVDLGLPKTKKPAPVDVLKSTFGAPRPVEHLVSNYAIGSSSGKEEVYHRHDLGLFETILQVWQNHWVLRTRPDDWWFPVAVRIAKAIDNAAQMEDRFLKGEKLVRSLFVRHEGKKTISVTLPVYNIFEVNYEVFFTLISKEVDGEIKLPGFVKVMQNNFSTSKVEHRIASQINLMASLQQFFEYGMICCGCGINGLEMLGQQNDWNNLSAKLREVQAMLKPIQSQIGFSLSDEWFSHVDVVFQNLAKTYSLVGSGGDPQCRPEVEQFWADILCRGWGVKYYGPSGRKQKNVEEYDGWLIKFLTGQTKVAVRDITPQKFSCLNNVPMKIKYTWCMPYVEDKGQLHTGLMGFTMSTSTGNEAMTCLEPYHMWVLQLDQDSPLRTCLGPDHRQLRQIHRFALLFYLLALVVVVVGAGLAQ